MYSSVESNGLPIKMMIGADVSAATLSIGQSRLMILYKCLASLCKIMGNNKKAHNSVFPVSDLSTAS